jgi:hypothetical protein
MCQQQQQSGQKLSTGQKQMSSQEVGRVTADLQVFRQEIVWQNDQDE